MRNTKWIFLALGCIAALGFTSCLGDDDNNEDQGLTKAEISQCVNAIQGSYSGKILYKAENPQNAADIVDTLDINWRVAADTSVVISNFPTEVFVQSIADSDLKAAMQAAEPVDLKAYLAFYKVSPVSFLLAPQTIDYQINYQDNSHKAQVVFWVSSYSYGAYDTTSRTFEMQLVAAALYLDGNTEKNYLNNGYSSTVSLPMILTNGNI